MGPNAGTLQLPDGTRLDVSNLRKLFWPKLKITKGELMRYYVRVAPFILPVVKDRPLIMKRFPNGIDGKAFYQQRAPESVPPGVRTATIPGDKDVPSRLIGGNLITLLYMTQLAAISQDPWFSRVQSPHIADHCAIDLDPMPGVKFAWVLDVARWVRDELEKLKVTGFRRHPAPAASTSSFRFAQGTPYEAGPDFLPDRRDGGRRETSEDRPRSRGRCTPADRRCTWTTCRTSRENRSPAPTARARASLPAHPRR